MLRARAALILILLTHACTSLDVNVPKPTILPIQSEIHRGYLAVFNCVLNTSPLSHQINRCGQSAIDDNVEKQTASDPFLLGVYLETWFTLHLAVMLRKQEAAERNAAEWLDRLRRQQEKTRISDEEMCEATKMECDELQRDLKQAELTYGPLTRERAQ